MLRIFRHLIFMILLRILPNSPLLSKRLVLVVVLVCDIFHVKLKIDRMYSQTYQFVVMFLYSIRYTSGWKVEFLFEELATYMLFFKALSTMVYKHNVLFLFQ